MGLMTPTTEKGGQAEEDGRKDTFIYNSFFKERGEGLSRRHR
jgi:hypothetical protein